MDLPTIIYLIYRMMSAQQTNLLRQTFCVRQPNNFETTPLFTWRLVCHILNFVTIRNFLGLHNHHVLNDVPPTLASFYGRMMQLSSLAPSYRTEWCTPLHSTHPRNKWCTPLHSTHPRKKWCTPPSLDPSYRTEWCTPLHSTHPIGLNDAPPSTRPIL